MNKASNLVKFSDGPSDLRAPTQAGETTIDLSRLIKAMRRRRTAIILSVLFWSMLGLFYALTTPRYYDATAQVMLDSNISRTLQQVSSATDSSITDSAMESARLVIGSEEIVARVVDSLQLQNVPDFVDPPISMTSQILGYAIYYARMPMVWFRQFVEERTDLDMTGAAAGPDTATAAPTEEEIAAIRRVDVITALQNTVSIYRIGRSSAFGISYRSTNPELAAAIVNAIADVYVSDVLNANFDATERMTTWMQTRLNILEADARAAAREAENFRSENGLVNNNNSTMSQDTVSALNADLSAAISSAAQARARVTALETVVDQGIDALVANGIPAGLPEIDSEEFRNNQSKLTNLVISFNRVKRSGTASSASIASWEMRVRNAAEQLFSAIRLQLEQARGEAALRAARVDALRDSLQQAVVNDAQVGSATVELRALEDRATTLSALYQNFLTRFQQIEQQNSFPVSNVRILNMAQVPRFAAGPSAKKALALCIVIGLIMGLIIAAIRERKDRFLYTSEQVTDEVGISFLGYLPEVPLSQAMITWISKRYSGRPKLRAEPAAEHAFAKRPGGLERIDAPPSQSLEKPRSAFTETLRNIRLSSQIVGRRGKGRVIGVTSARPNEGKTYTSYNLATLIAAGGQSVMLIDADPHRCGLSRFFNIDAREGLLDVLSDERDWANVCKIVGETGVTILPGQVRAEFAYTQEMLASQAFSQLIREFTELYDVVLLDLAPMGAVSDVRAVIDDVDHLVLIAEWGKTSKQLLYKLVHADTRIADKILGVALNRVDFRRLQDYAGDGDKASYYYDYGSYYA